MSKMIFIFIICLWLTIGCFGIHHAKENKINWFGIIFLFTSPLLAIAAYLCNII